MKFAAAVYAGGRASPGIPRCTSLLLRGTSERGILRRLFANLTWSRGYTENPSILGRYEHAVLLAFRLLNMIYGNHLISVYGRVGCPRAGR